MIKMKLKIGAGTTIKEEKKEETDCYSELSDEELETLQEEVDNDTKLEEDEEVEKLIEEDTKEAVNGVGILEKVGVNIDYVNEFTKKYPSKKTIYRNIITKKFLEWYIKNVKISHLKQLKILDSEYINQNQIPYLTTLVQERLHEKIDIKEKDSEKVILEAEEENQMYELLLDEKWDNRTKGIMELDDLIKEQIKTKECNVQQALYNLINIFKLDKKLKKTLLKEEKKETPKKSKTKAKEEKKYITPKEIKKSIIYFHHIEFLYNLMSEKMDFVEDPTPEEIKKIETITNLWENTTPTTPAKIKNKESTTMDNFFEED